MQFIKIRPLNAYIKIKNETVETTVVPKLRIILMDLILFNSIIVQVQHNTRRTEKLTSIRPKVRVEGMRELDVLAVV